MEGEALDLIVHGTLPDPPWTLADSAWPRTGGDRRNSRRVSVEGPTLGEVRAIHQLPEVGAESVRGARAGIAAAGETIRVAWCRQLFAFDLRGELLWSTAIRRGDGEDARFNSAPLVLSDGTSVVLLDDTIAFVGANGSVRATVVTGGYGLDDSGPAPNLTGDGRLVLTTPIGDVFLLAADGTATSIGAFGYDIVPPAFYDDGTMAISGYAGSGLVRVRPSGERVWSSGFGDADLTPTISSSAVVAVGSLNDGESRFYSPSGQELGTYPAPAVFGDLSRDSWIALTSTSVANINSAGEVAWKRELGGEIGHGWGALGPAIDREGRVYFPSVRGVGCVARDGSPVFDVLLPEVPSDLAVVAEGLLAVVAGGTVYMVT